MRELQSIAKAYDIRGVVPDQFDEEIARAVGAGFADLVAREAGTSHTTLVIARDMRESGVGLTRAFAAGAMARGVNVIDMGMGSTDELYFASGSLGLAGAMFTASHNPARYNGIKMCRPGAKPISSATGLDDIRKAAEGYLQHGVAEAPHQGGFESRDMLRAYGEFLRGLVDLSDIRNLRVVVDAGNGMAGLTVPAVLGESAGLPALPLDIVPLYFELDGSFPNHEANPLDPKNLVDLQQAVVEHGADIGLAFDGDADRCFVVDDRGQAVSPSAITALVGLREIAREQARGVAHPVVIHNLITSRAVPEMISAAGARPVRTRVGHSFIKAQMAQEDAVFGGEHSAHYYFRDFYFADSGMLAAMHVLAALGEQTGTLSDLTREYSPYVASGEINSQVANSTVARDRAVAAIEADSSLGRLEVDTLDGVTVSHWDSEPRWWFNLRASNTEPLLRLNAEAESPEVLAAMRDRVLALVRAEADE